MSKLDEVKADCVSGEVVMEALAIYQAILEKRVLLVPVEPTKGFPSMEQTGAAEMWEQTKNGLVGHDQARAVYKAMTQAVDVDKLIEEILNLLNSTSSIIAKYERMEAALTRIAVYSEGEKVTSAFDEPFSATVARKALED